MHFLAFVVLLAIGPLVHTSPSNEIQVDDILYTPKQLQFFEGNKASRLVISFSQYYWKNSTLVYSFGVGLSKCKITKNKTSFLIKFNPITASVDMTRVQSAMNEISSQTCVKFRRTFNRLEPQVVIQRKDGSCTSHVGYLGRIDQELNLGIACMSSVTIQHELLHALGFFHTQSDPQRDQYVRIYPRNIIYGYENNFAKLRAEGVTDFGLGYDYESIMHYGPYAFSRSGDPTILPLQAKAKIGQATRLSPRDVETLNRMYC
ncbi:hypothetical protein KR032_002390 [Drosophila birchii]|nr:hypothetical protein KR032_002390 [Drosophila birchii]